MDAETLIKKLQKIIEKEGKGLPVHYDPAGCEEASNVSVVMRFGEKVIMIE